MTSDDFKKLRKAAGYTQATLAKEMGVHLRTVTRWEIGEIIIPRVVELALRYIADHKKKSRISKLPQGKLTPQDEIDLAEAKAALLEAKKTGHDILEEVQTTFAFEEASKKTVSGRTNHG